MSSDAPKAFLKKVGLRIRRLREQRELTLEKTEELGFPNWRHFQAIESGRKNITLTTIWNIAKVLKVDPADLFK